MDALSFLNGHVPLFSGLSEEALKGLAINSTLRQLTHGQTVIRAGMVVDSLYVIATGKVEVYAKIAGRGFVFIAELGPGEVFGEMAILEQTVASATLKAGPEGAFVLAIPEAPFHRLLEDNRDFAVRVRALVKARRRAPPPATPPAKTPPPQTPPA